MPQKVRIILLQVLALWVTLITGFSFVHNPRCMQNCSWTSYKGDGSPVESLCAFNISEGNIAAFSSCPNPWEHVNHFITVAEIVNVRFYSIHGTTNEETSLCANITFKVQRGHEADLKGIRITAEPTSYRDVNSVLCQIWHFTAPLDSCSLTTGRCSSDVGRERHFYYDCFCGFGPGPGKLNVSVDVLPKPEGQHQSFIEYSIPGCDDAVLTNNKYCKPTEEERWRPLYASYTQLCDYDSVNVTFDILDASQGVSSYYVFLYETDFMNCTISTNEYAYLQEVNMMTADITERNISHRVVKFTTVTISGLSKKGLDKQYIIGFKIKEPNGFPTHQRCPPLIKLRDDPCKSSPCSSDEVCTSDCWDYTCNCTQGLIRIRNRCRAPWHPAQYRHHSSVDSVVIVFDDGPPPEYNVTRYSIVLLTDTTGIPLKPQITSLCPSGGINATFDHVVPDEYYTPAIRIHEDECPACQFQYYEPFKFVPQETGFAWGKLHTLTVSFLSIILIVLLVGSVVCLGTRGRKQGQESDPFVPDVELPESPNVSRASLSGIRLICNPSSLLQDFADHLRQLLQVHLECPVSVHTVSDPGQAMTSRWLSDARAQRETLCFLWDENLAILEYKPRRPLPDRGCDKSCDASPDHWRGCTVSSAVLHLTDCDLDHSVLLLLDFAAPVMATLPDCPRFFLPSGLSEFLQQMMNLSIVEQGVDKSDVLSAYDRIVGVARMNVCERSTLLWDRVHQEFAEDSGIVLESESDDEISLDEEEPNESIIETSAYLDAWHDKTSPVSL